jgi:hypothetical protein
MHEHSLPFSNSSICLIKCNHDDDVSLLLIKGLFGWAVAVKKVAVGCELWKKLL